MLKVAASCSSGTRSGAKPVDPLAVVARMTLRRGWGAEGIAGGRMGPCNARRGEVRLTSARFGVPLVG